jgi:signal transduction histidine kinase
MRTPVATLDAYVEGLEDGVATLDADIAAVLRAQTSRLARLADDVSAISRAEENQLDLHPTASEPRKLVTAAIKAASELFAAKGVTLAADAASGLPMVLVDRDRLGQALGNLLDNALRHTPVGGTVTIGARPADGGHVELFVSDTGEGIPAEHLPHVFERFYRVDQARDRAHGGSGIGLAIAKALVEAHGGRISVTSSGPGKGSTFVIRLATARAGAR